ncbi:hypothetical protein [Bradyrhizobium sp. SBR1B]|uniref:hypothetical protein n=1 Tax=Bradyrhizobium sp. SBR1B TaxID=2663836 RepID=UPI0016068545|nr:hypothetical protein [Bradyrhizobium sp. SBR1B]MBB4383233.1 hypothetical protein [Bradyrhizobium sp. SBR1B]
MPRKLAAYRGGLANFAKEALSCSTLLAGIAVASIGAKADEVNLRQFECASIVCAHDIHPSADAVAALCGRDKRNCLDFESKHRNDLADCD